MRRVIAPILFVIPLFGCGEPKESLSPPRPIPPVTTAEPPAVATGPRYPKTRRGDEADVLHGEKVQDPYRWLEDPKNEAVKSWVSEQDAFARAHLTKLPERDAIAKRLRELYYIESMGLPHHFGKNTFFTRREASKEKSVVYVRERKQGAQEHVLLDPMAWAEDGSISLGGFFPSWDGKKVAYKVKPKNSDEATLYVLDVATGKKLPDVIEGAKYGGVSWTPKGDGFYYTWIPPEGKVSTSDRPGYQEIRFHKLGESPDKDTVVRERTGDPKTFQQASLSKNGRYLVVQVEHGWTRSDVHYKDLSKKGASWRTLTEGKDALYDIGVYRDTFYVTTNEGAAKYRVFQISPDAPERDKWKEIVSERSDATLLGTNIVGGKLSLAYLKDVKTELRIHDTSGKLVRELSLPTLGTASVLSGDEDDDTAYYSFASFTYPSEIFETSIKTGTTKSYYRVKAPVSPEQFSVEQLFATSKDGTKVPMFVVAPKDLKKDGSARTILYGYGGFQNAVTPSFNTGIYPWIERGGVYVFANLRGGNEYGEQWHRNGMRHKKQNVFDDFIAVAEHLIQAKVTSRERLVIRGGSNGGLLVGAAMTQRPDLFRAVLCGVPLLDMVRYHAFGSGKTWIEEYGSSDNKEDFQALYAYSPYHHVKEGTKYPSLLILSADADDRVDPMHARKFAAAMQEASRGGPVLVRVEKNSGHGGADLVRALVERVADELAFALSETDK